jgi:hypothetical protein
LDKIVSEFIAIIFECWPKSTTNTFLYLLLLGRNLSSNSCTALISNFLSHSCAALALLSCNKHGKVNEQVGTGIALHFHGPRDLNNATKKALKKETTLIEAADKSNWKHQIMTSVSLVSKDGATSKLKYFAL